MLRYSLLLLPFLIYACKGDSGSTRTVPTLEITATGNLHAGCLAIQVVNELNQNLSQQTSLTGEQSRMIAVAAAGALNIAKTGLMLAGSATAETYEDSIEEFSDELVEGALDALDKLENVHQRQINKVVSIVVSSVMESLEGRTDHLDVESLSRMLFLISEGAVQHLDEAGYSLLAMAEATRVIVAAAVGALDDGGILNESNGEKILVAIVSGAVKGLVESPIAASSSKVVDYSLVLDDLLYGAVGSLDDAGFPLETIDESVEHVLFAAVSQFDELGLSAADLEMPIEAAIHGALDALQREAGIHDAAQLEDALGFCVSGAVKGLAHTTYSMADMDEVIGFIIKKTAQHIDNLGVSDSETETVMEEIVLSGIMALDDIGYTSEHVAEHGDVMGDVVVAAMEALAEVGFTHTEISDFLDDIIASSFQPLLAHGLTKVQSQAVGTHFLSSLEAGLIASRDIVFAYDANAMNAHVQTALQAIYGP